MTHRWETSVVDADDGCGLLLANVKLVGVAMAVGGASAMLLTGCLLSQFCTAKGCNSRLELMLPAIPLEDAARFDGASIEVCHNEVCGTALLPPAPPNASVGYSFNVEDPIHTYVEGYVTRYDADSSGYAGDLRIVVRIRSRDSLLIDGDIYSATVTAADAGVITRAAFRATYHDVYVNGEDCDDRPCRVAELTRLGP